ncbi:MAG: hypothetical protein VW338_07920 [Rhodospirillaceae bacterium]
MTQRPAKLAILLALGVAAVAALAPAPALADRIDGYWCRGTKQFFIEGPQRSVGGRPEH